MIESAGAGYAAVDSPVAVTPEVPSAETLEADAPAALLATEVPQQLAVPLTITVRTPAGIEVGEFEVQKTAMVKELKVQLASLQSVHVPHLTVLHAEEILEDTCRWSATSVNDKDFLTLVVLYKEPLQDEIITQAVADYFQGREAKVKMVEKHGELSLWDTSNVTNMKKLFFGQSTFNEDLSAWNVGRVTNMNSMFSSAGQFNGDLSAWNVGKVTSMCAMFNRAERFNGDLNAWNVSFVKNMGSMFEGATSFNGDLSAWNVSAVTNMEGMFAGATAFNGDLSAWNVGCVTDMSFMFTDASRFNRDLSAWNVSNVTNMQRMFWLTRGFNGDLSAWNVSDTTSKSFMFSYCPAPKPSWL